MPNQFWIYKGRVIPDTGKLDPSQKFKGLIHVREITEPDLLVAAKKMIEAFPFGVNDVMPAIDELRLAIENAEGTRH